MIDNLKKIDKESIKTGAKEIAEAAVEHGVDTVKIGIFSILNGIIIKFVMVFGLIVTIVAVGCVSTNVAINKFTADKPTITVQ